MSSYESDIWEPIYGAYNWAEFEGNQPLPDEYVPPYMRSSTADKSALPARDVLRRASKYVNNTTPSIPTAFGGNMLRRAAHLRAVTVAQVEANKEGKKNKKKEEPRKDDPVDNPVGAVAAIFGDGLYRSNFPDVYVKAPQNANSYQPPIELSSSDADFRKLLALTWGGDCETAASDRSLVQVGAGDFSYTYTPYRAGINLRALPVVSQELPASDDRRLRMNLFRYELTKKVDEILDQYGLPKERYVQPCGRKRALHLMERPIPTILITMRFDKERPKALELALHFIVIMASEYFLLHDISVEVIDPRLEHPAEHPDPEPAFYPRRPRGDRTGAMIAPPLELALILIAWDWYRWDPETWELTYVPESV